MNIQPQEMSWNAIFYHLGNKTIKLNLQQLSHSMFCKNIAGLAVPRGII